MKTESITLTSLVDEIAFRLETAILEGEFRPGTHLLQDELCARFGVSRTPVREALRKLQAQHLVIVVPNKGATVRFPSEAELRDPKSLGLLGIRERAFLLGGNVEIEGKSGEGTTVTLSIPHRSAAAS